MKKSEFKKLTLDKAKKDLEKSKKDLFNLRFQQVNGQLTNTSKFNKIKKNIAAIEASAKTMIAPIIVSFFVGQVILKVSCFTSWINFSGFFII